MFVYQIVLSHKLYLQHQQDLFVSKGKYLDRPMLKSYKKKESGWTAKFHKLYPNAKTIKKVHMKE